MNSVRTPHWAAVTHSHIHSRHMGACVICCHGIDFLFYLSATDLCLRVFLCVFNHVALAVLHFVGREQHPGLFKRGRALGGGGQQQHWAGGGTRPPAAAL